MKTLVFRDDSKLFDGHCMRFDAKAVKKVVRCGITLAAQADRFTFAPRRSATLRAVRRGLRSQFGADQTAVLSEISNARF